MVVDQQDIPALVKEVRRQLALSQKYLARELRSSLATGNRWGKRHIRPSKLAKGQFHSFWTKMIRRGKLSLPEGKEYRG